MDVASLPSLLAIPNSFGAPPSASPGEIVDALVLALLDNGLVRLQVPDGTLDVRTAVPLAVGAKVRLAINGTSAGLQVVVLTDGSGRSGAPATVVARQTADGAARAGGEPAPAGSEPAVEIALSGATAPMPQSASPPLAPAAESIGDAVQAAASRQGSLAPLLADLEQALKTEALPQPLAAVAARVLDARLPLEGLGAAGLRQALARSGLFLEASLGANLAPGSAPASGLDLKTVLLVLRQILQAWAQSELRTAVAALGAAASPPPPPYRGAPPSAQPPAQASLPPYAPSAVVAQRLLAETDAALARHTLLQLASVRENDAGSHASSRAAQWAFEIPLVAGPGSAIAQFEITRDAHAVAAEASFTWRVRFSVNVEPMGPVHALIALAGERAAVTLWAEREASAAHLRANGALLEDALRGAALEPRDIQFRVGAPAAPPPTAGRFLDRAS
jgi:Flagellar hook-length control protein FliK